MSELHDLLERRADTYQAPADLLARVHDRERRRARKRRVGTSLAALLATAVAIAGLADLLTPPRNVVFNQTPNPLVGTWVSTDVDGSTQTMTILAPDDAVYEVTVADDDAAVCSGAPSTMTGSARLNGADLTIAAPVFTCDDGSGTLELDPPLEEQLRDYTLAYDADTKTLTDNLGVQWRRPSAAPDPEASEPTGPYGMWPQTNRDEVREAQLRADDGDPDYAWQVDPSLDAERGIGRAEIFTRFLAEVLGWEQTRYVGSDSDSVTLGDDSGDGVVDAYAVTFVRCAPGRLNPLYPDEPKRRSCAPTVDDVTYETVQVSVFQPLRTSPDGIWVVRSWRTMPSVRQAAPLHGEELANLAWPFLQTRFAGEGAERYLDSAAEVPLLYETSRGKPYVGGNYEQRAVWPTGRVELHYSLSAAGKQPATGGDWLVEQDFVVHPGRDKITYEGETIENGTPVAEPHTLLDGQITFRVAAALGSWQGLCCFTPSGEDMEGVQGYLSDLRNEFVVVVDPLPPTGDCGVGDEPPSAAQLVRSIQSSRDLRVTTSGASVGGIEAVRLDIIAHNGATLCSQALDSADESVPVMAPRTDDAGPPMWYGMTPDNQARLYVFALPGNDERTVAVVIRGPRSTFSQLAEGVRPILDSIRIGTSED